MQPKPKWLRKLERESWQAELIISGAAILGSLQLPGVLERVEVYCLLNFDRDTLFLCYLALIYWRILTYCLIVAFVFHFIVRALWIGMVGLNSVYTEGFKPNKRFATHYQENLKEEYGDIDGYIERLDRLGSGVFGVSFGTALVFFNFGLIGSLLVYLHSWLVSYEVPSGWVFIGLGIIFVPIFLLSLGAMILQMERFKEGALARRYMWPVSTWVSRFSYLVGRRYVLTSTNMVSSHHADSKGFGWYLIGGFVGFMIILLTTLLNARYTRYFVDQAYHRMGSDSTWVATAYADELAYDGVYVQPRIGEATASFLTLWIPAPEREWAFLEGQCDEPKVPDEIEREQRRGLNRLRVLTCARAYYSFAINGSAVTDFDIKQQSRVNEAARQLGFHVYVPKPKLKIGANMLRVTSRYPHEETGANRVTYTPFYFSQDAVTLPTD